MNKDQGCDTPRAEPRETNRLLNLVRSPARYTGGELNLCLKDWRVTPFRVCLCFPDLYEIGMSNLGLRVIYDIINRQPACLAERVFAPDRDMEELLRRRKIPLVSLESGRPLADFDLVGFTLASELTYTNVLTVLELGGIPLCAVDRGDGDPLVVAGGNGAFSPEPLADFFDAFLVGEGEDFAGRVGETLLALSGNAGRRERLEALARLPGVYVPVAHEASFCPDGSFSGLRARNGRTPTEVKRVIAVDFEHAPFPVRWLVPYLPVVHDRVGLEIMRGCVHRCHFCQARVIYGPCRARSPETLGRLARECFQATGYEEMSLLSLSSGDYPRLNDLRAHLEPFCAANNIRISFPSLRADTLDLEATGSEPDRKRAGLTLAPESSEQLRLALGKPITDRQLFEQAEKARAAGWRRLKLYFMLGLPGETPADIAEIARLVEGLSRRLRISASFNTFIPKPHTPLERAGMITQNDFEEKTGFLKSKLRGNRFVSLRFHAYRQSFLEALLCRGDRRAGALILEAWRLGARLDGWQDSFSFAPWAAALENCPVDPARWLAPLPEERALPWEHVKI